MNGESIGDGVSGSFGMPKEPLTPSPMPPPQPALDILKNRPYNNYKRVASKRKSSLPATRFYFAKMNIAMKKCVACQRKSSLYDKVRTFFVPKRKELKKWRKATR